MQFITCKVINSNSSKGEVTLDTPDRGCGHSFLEPCRSGLHDAAPACAPISLPAEGLLRRHHLAGRYRIGQRQGQQIALYVSTIKVSAAQIHHSKATACTSQHITLCRNMNTFFHFKMVKRMPMYHETHVAQVCKLVYAPSTATEEQILDCKSHREERLIRA